VGVVGGIPESIGPYEIEAKLANGALGILVRARARPARRLVALRILKSALASDAVYVTRLERQLERARVIVHRHLATPIAWGAVGDRYVVASTFAEGKSVATYRNDHGLDFETAGMVLGDITSALSALHERDFVHEGINAEKVVVSEDRRATLVGAGMVSFGAYSMLTTRRDQIMGDVNYLAPEAIMGFEPGPPADVYALSCVAFTCLTGHSPFRDASMYEIPLAHLERPAPRLGEAVTGVPAAWATVVDAGLANNPKERPTAQDFAAVFRGPMG
jgi:serine/threonine protein kinase